MDKVVDNLKSKAAIKQKVFREFMAEFLGTFMLLLIGNGTNAVFTFHQSVTNTPTSYMCVAFGWGLGITSGVMISGGISGGHINPAVTLAMACFGKLPLIKVPVYWLAQYLGAFTGAAVTYAGYKDTLLYVDPNTNITSLAGIWGTQPAPQISMGQAFGDQVIGAMILLLLVSAITDKNNMNVAKGMIPLYVGFTVCMVALAYGYNAGFAINPARDLSPRLLSLAIGYKESFTLADSGYWWIPIVACHIGGIIGAGLYFFGVEMHWPETDEVPISDGRGAGVTAKSLNCMQLNHKDSLESPMITDSTSSIPRIKC